MKLFQNVKLSRKVLFTHKLRTYLALVGISIGVGSVIVMVSIGEGAQRTVLHQIESMGSNLLVVNSGKLTNIVGRMRQTGRVTTLKLKDWESIRDQCPSVQSAAPAQDKTLKVKYGSVATMTKIMGTTRRFPSIRNSPIQKGRFFTQEENKAGVRLAVIGADVKKHLFEGEDSIGEIVRIRNIPFKVIGVLKSKGVSAEGANEDNQILIPIRTALRRVFNLDYINTIYLQVKSKELMDRAESEIRELLRENHRLNVKNKSDDFTIQNQIRVLETEKETSRMFTLLISGIAAISLLVSGIGIMAIMLLSVKERTHEIGLRMAVGARPKDIRLQFLSEAAILGSLGGCIGVLVGIAGSIATGYFSKWNTIVSSESLIISLIFSFSVGLFFGVYPAKKAVLLDPIEALRTE